ncbi:TetR/AcrR family transcriptional regulator [Pollutibacter soli]|uniref:TetR/AcrR family transcriptional regulator n=1 Tax=Pollutibacter soli TaxID=3034157 RepID=UPI003013759A
MGDKLIREQGYNGFSFTDISKVLGIRNASIHYYFPTKTDLGIAVVKRQHEELNQIVRNSAKSDPVKQLSRFMDMYNTLHNDGQVCIVGSLATDLNTIEKPVRKELKFLADDILLWMKTILEEGKKQGIFHYKISSRAKALLIISNIMAALQLSRITDPGDFDLIRNSIIKELKTGS